MPHRSIAGISDEVICLALDFRLHYCRGARRSAVTRRVGVEAAGTNARFSSSLVSGSPATAPTVEGGHDV